MSNEVNFKKPLLWSIAFHLGVAACFVSVSFTGKPTPMEMLAKKPQPTLIEAKTVNEAEITKAIKQVKAKAEAKRQAKIREVRRLEARARAAKQARAREQARVRKLKAARKAAAAKRAAEQAKLAKLKKQREAEQKALAAAKAKREKAKAEEKRRIAEEKRRKAEAAARKKAAEAAAKAKAKAKAEAARFARVLSRYKSAILHSISRNWIIPPGADPGLSCELLIRLGPGGIVRSVSLSRSSGDPALDRSATAAVYKASPLPVPSDPALFDKFKTVRLTVRPEGLIDS